jgi:putative PIN family toxin of toxin-antitoxin system
VRAVVDVNVLISALLAPAGAPAQVLVAWQAGRFEMIVSPTLLTELERALTYPKLRTRIEPSEADAFVDSLRRSAALRPDPDLPPPARSTDPDDDYLIALAADQDAVLVTGDRHLLEVSDPLPIRNPASFLAMLR